MLPARPAEAGQGMAGHIVPARDRDLADRVGHIGDCDLDEAFGQGFARDRLACFSFDAAGQRGELFAHHRAVDRLIASGAEYVRELIGHQLAQHHVAIGNGQRPAAAIARRARHSSGAVRSDHQPPHIEPADRSAACRHGVDPQHRRADPHPGNAGFAVTLKRSGIVADIG